jgi:hypothetical protein
MRKLLFIAFTLIIGSVNAQNVGISSNLSFNPQYRLDVDGVARIADYAAIGVNPNASYRLYVYNSSNNYARIASSQYGLYARGSTSAVWGFNSTLNGHAVRAEQGSSGFSIYADGVNSRNFFAGNVGVGELNPTNKLQVNGNGRFGTSPNNFVYISSGAVIGSGGLEIFTSSNIAYIRYHDPMVAWRDISLNNAGGNVGVGTDAPTERLDINGDVRVRNLSSNVPYVRLVNPEMDGTLSADLQFLWGNIDSDGWINGGSANGFTTSLVTTGVRRITFLKPFSMRPTCTCVQHHPNSGSNWFSDAGIGGNTRDNCLTTRVQNNIVDFRTGDGNGNAQNRSFSFICVGAVTP